MTQAQIIVREKLWIAAKKGAGLKLEPEEVTDLWGSILKTHVHLVKMEEERKAK